jgi:maltose/moltooligosaccharide transporter
MLTMQRRLSRPFLVLLTLPATAMGFALSVQISALSWILSTKYGLDLHEIGLVWAAGPLAGIVGQLLVGVISDRVWLWGGRRRPFIVVGGLLAALMLLALPNIGLIASSLGIESLLGVAVAVALALDLSINVGFNPTRSLVADVTPEGALRTRGYTWMQTVSGTFGVLAYGIGAVFGNEALIYAGAALSIAFSVIPALLVEEPRSLGATATANETGDDGDAPSRAPAARETAETSGRPDAAHSPGARRIAIVLMPLWGVLAYDLYALGAKLAHAETTSLWPEALCGAATLVLFAITMAARDRGAEFVREDLVEFRKVLAAHSLSWFGVQTMFVYMIGFVQQRFPGVDADGAGRILSIAFLVLNAVGALMPALVLEPLSRRCGQVAVHATCVATMAAAYAGVYVAATTPVALYAWMALLGIGWGAIVSLPFAIMSQRCDRSRIGLYMGVFNLSVVLPQLLTSLAVGALLSRIEDKGAMFLIAAASLAASALAWTFVRRQDDAAVAAMPGAASH